MKAAGARRVRLSTQHDPMAASAEAGDDRTGNCGGASRQLPQ